MLDWQTIMIAVTSFVVTYDFKKLNTAFIVLAGAVTGYILSPGLDPGTCQIFVELSNACHQPGSILPRFGPPDGSGSLVIKPFYIYTDRSL